MTAIDLDRLEAWANHEDHSDQTCQDSDRMLLKLATELWAAREVVEAARWIERTGALPPTNEVGARRLSDLEKTVRAYDEVVGS